MSGPLFQIFKLFSGGATQDAVIYAVLSLFSVLVIIFVVFPIHECAHALTAKLLGDDTAERMGRVTLNPLKHIDLMGALLMLLCNIGWAKPTPVDIRKCTKFSMRTCNVLVSLAGPVSNILLALLFMIIEKVLLLTLPYSFMLSCIDIALFRVIQLNLYLAVFNLVPVPPLDGYHVLSSFLPPKALVFMERNGQIINWVFFILILTGILSQPLSWGANGLLWLLDFITGFLG